MKRALPFSVAEVTERLPAILDAACTMARRCSIELRRRFFRHPERQ
jgi:hypothetical protein